MRMKAIIENGVAREVSSLRHGPVSREEERIREKNEGRIRETGRDFPPELGESLERERDDRKGGGSAKHGVTKFSI